MNEYVVCLCCVSFTSEAEQRSEVVPPSLHSGPDSHLCRRLLPPLQTETQLWTVRCKTPTLSLTTEAPSTSVSFMGKIVADVELKSWNVASFFQRAWMHLCPRCWCCLSLSLPVSHSRCSIYPSNTHPPWPELINQWTSKGDGSLPIKMIDWLSLRWWCITCCSNWICLSLTFFFLSRPEY